MTKNSKSLDGDSERSYLEAAKGAVQMRRDMSNVKVVDWGGGAINLVILSLKDGRRIRENACDFGEYIFSLKGPCIVVIESTFEPYNRQRHNQIVEYCRANGIELLTISPRETSNYRLTQGIAYEDATDMIDARAIWAMYHEGRKHFSRARLWDGVTDPGWQDATEEARRSGWPAQYSAPLYAKLPSPGSVPLDIREALLNGKTYAEGFVLPVTALAQAVKAGEAKGRGNSTDRSRDIFEQELGCFGAGGPSYPRATFYRRVRTLDQRALDVRSFRKANINIIADHGELHKESMKTVRKAVRWIFSQVEIPRAQAIP